MIALVDCNNFYASCERLFQPSLRGKPIVVLSNNDRCVIARSDEAKQLGIAMGERAHLIEQTMKEKGVTAFSSNYNLYGSLSDRVMRTLASQCPTMEVYSIDEAFLYLGDLPISDLWQYGYRLRALVLQNIGIPVSVGVAPTKTLAKLANRYAKKFKKEIGLHILDTPEKVDHALKVTAVGDVWGIGRQYAALLEKHDVHTAYELSKVPDEWIRKNMSVVGQRLVNELRGIPCIDMELEPPAKKGICSSRSFGVLVTSKVEIAEALTTYISTAALKLRRQGSCTKLINVFVQTNQFRTQDKQYYRSVNVPLPVASSSTRELIHYGMLALDLIFKPGYNYHKCGVMLTEIVPDDQVQFGMFDELNREKEAKLMAAMDGINQVMGRGKVRFAVQGHKQRWKLRAEMLSQCYTTRLSDVLVVQC
jgi:DNA polymerase V